MKNFEFGTVPNEKKDHSQMKKIVIFLIVFILIPKFVFAENTVDTASIIEEQKNTFGINDFLKECEKYEPDYLKDLDIKNIFNSSITGKIGNQNILKKILKPFGSEITEALKIFINILVIVLIHSLLKSMTDGLENGNVSQIVYYVQYILIVTIIMASFSGILTSINETIDNMIGFAGSLVPLLISLMLYTGSITTSGVLEPILLFLIEFIANFIKVIIIPVTSLITVLIIVSKISDRIQINKLSKFMKSSIVWTLGVILTVFIGVVSLEGSLTSSVDGITAKTAKAAVSSLIPVVRKNSWRRCR